MTTADQTRPSTTENNFDADSLREKYRREPVLDDVDVLLIGGGFGGLQGKRIAIIGTGATAVQCVPHLGETAEHLYVFQRTPSCVDTRNNSTTDPNWAASLEPGWHRHRMKNFNSLVSGVPLEEDLVDDGWVQTILEKGAGGAILGGEGCTPGYYNNEGKPNPLAAQAMPYGGGPVQFFGILKKWREQGNFEGLEFKSG
jgi:hypothetical protein